jgi:hypothetical protein
VERRSSRTEMVAPFRREEVIFCGEFVTWGDGPGLPNRVWRPGLFHCRRVCCVLRRLAVQARARSADQLAEALAQDDVFVSVLQLILGRPDLHLATELVKLMTPESVPFLAALGPAEARGPRRADRPDPGPAKVRSGRLRKRRRLAPPGLAGCPDGALHLLSRGGARRQSQPHPRLVGWDHLQQAMALATVALDRRQRDGWTGNG